MLKWYNVEIPYNTKETIKRAEKFKDFLHNNGFYFEPSACGNMVHFEIKAAETDLKKLNAALDKIVWFDAITAQ